MKINVKKRSHCLVDNPGFIGKGCNEITDALEQCKLLLFGVV